MEATTREAELAELVSDAVNVGIDSEAFVDAVGRDHRYLQGQVFDQLLKPLVCEFARKAEKGMFDARNERQVKECREVADAMGWSY